MMISLGYYFDQVSRERMAQRISEQVELIAGVDAGECAGLAQATSSGSKRRIRSTTS